MLLKEGALLVLLLVNREGLVGEVASPVFLRDVFLCLGAFKSR